MRHLPTGRGQHHKCSATTRRMWAFEESAAAASIDLCGGLAVAATGAPGRASDGWLGPTYATFGGAAGYTTGAGFDHAQLVANAWTIRCVWRRRASLAGTIFCYGGNSALATNNVLARLKMLVDGTLTFEWEDATPTLRSVNVAGFVLPLGKWVDIELVRTTATNVDLYVNGRKVASMNMTAANSGGSLSLWNIGMDEGAANKIQGDLGELTLETVAQSAVTIYDDWRRAMLWAFPTSVYGRVKMKDGLGVYRDMTALEGYDWVDSFSISENVDDPCETATINLVREHDDLSLANLVTSSKLNLTDVTNLASYSPLVTAFTETLIEMARVPLAHVPLAADWQQRFHGYIDEPDWGGDGNLKAEARDDGCKLVDDFMSTDLWTDADPFPAGVSCAADPVTGAGRASMEEAIQNVLNHFSGAVAPTLNAPSPANVCLLEWDQKKDSLMAICRLIAGTRAWDFGYMFDETPGQNTTRPTLIDPGRSRVDADGVFTREDYATVSRAALSVLGIRNRVMLTYGDKSNRNGDLVPVPTTITVVDNTSKAKFGGFYRTIFVTEGDSSPVKDSATATVMANGIRDDLKDPLVAGTVPVNFCAFECELYDIDTFVGDNVTWTGDQVLATSTLQLEYKEGAGKVDLGVRGSPSAGHRRWLEKDSRPGMHPTSWGVGGNSNTSNTHHGLDGRHSFRVFDQASHEVRHGVGIKGSLVKNADFDRWTLGAGFCPDSWFTGDPEDSTHTPGHANKRQRSLTSLTKTLAISSTNLTSARSILFDRNVYVPSLVSEFFQVEEGKVYGIEFIAKRNNAGLGLKFAIEWYDGAKAWLSDATTFTWATGGSGTFIKTKSQGQSVGNVYTAPANARFARLRVWSPTSGPAIYNPNAADYLLDFATVYLVAPDLYVYLGADQTPITDATLTTVQFNTALYDFYAAFDLATFTWTCPEDGFYDILTCLGGKVTGTMCTFQALQVGIIGGAGPLGSIFGASVPFRDAAAANVVSGRATSAYSGYFAKGDTLTSKGWITQVAGTTPVRAWIAGQATTFLRIKQRSLDA